MGKKRTAIEAGFVKKDYNAAMSAQGVQRYACSYNYAYFTRREPAVRGIPRNLSSVKRLMERTFTSPITFPEPLIVPVVDANFDPESQTELPTINADEIRDAYILAIARDIKLSHNPKDDERLHKWKWSMLTVSAEFRFFDSEKSVFNAACSNREEKRDVGDYLGASPKQRSAQIVIFMRSLEADKKTRSQHNSSLSLSAPRSSLRNRLRLLRCTLSSRSFFATRPYSPSLSVIM